MNDTQEGELQIGNSDLEVIIRIAGELAPYRLSDRRRGIIYADAGYRYGFTREDGQKITTWNVRPRYESHRTDANMTVFTGTCDLDGQTLKVEHLFTIPTDEPYIEEQIILRNLNDQPVILSSIGCGFLRTLRKPGGEWLDEVKPWRAVAVPYRRETQGRNGEYEDFSMEELASQSGWYRSSWGSGRLYTPEHGAEGWILTDEKSGLLIIKYSQDLMEFSLLCVEGPDGGTFLRFGGCGIWHGDPEDGTRIAPGESVAFGVTRYIPFDGEWKEGYSLFRDFMDAHGHVVPADFNPPVHWNELYDNPLAWGPDTKERREEFYRLADMEVEAAKAKEVGCEALYLDPGWDTSFASSVWADDRMGTLPEFVKLMREKYNLAVSLHTPLAGWCDAEAYPRECDRMTADGTILTNLLCSGSRRYLEVKTEQLLKLALEGAIYFMFDGSNYTGPCCHPDHGHPIPYTLEAHCRSYLQLTRNIHERFPNVILEMHDMLVAGAPIRYCPTYYLHGLPGSFDEIWAFEFMWDPMDDLISGKAISLYYYNLAYSLPAYLHISEKTDNYHCLAFWWYASTVRHLGIGGVGDDKVKLAALKRAMQKYMSLKEYFVQGTFYGIDETTHVHTLRRKGAIVLWFNLDWQPVNRSVNIDLREIGIDPETYGGIEGSEVERQGERLIGTVAIPSRGVVIREITVK